MRYWYQYIQYIQVTKNFIRSERTSDWLLHLSSVEKMLNLFAATGHIHYAKSGRLYLQKMEELPHDHPDIYNGFLQNGYHSIRRSDRFWAGLSSDLIIEQVMMRSLKTSGGLTRGRGIEESTRNQWVMTAHKFAAIHENMQELSGIARTTSAYGYITGKKNKRHY